VTAGERLDRLESLAAIRQLAVRYAQAVDARDLDELVSLFVPDVRVGREHQGRAALRSWFAAGLRDLRVTIHEVAGHVVDLDGRHEARGVVYCHDQIEPISGAWHHGMLQYWDSYRRVVGPGGPEWCFERRQLRRWYRVDALERPAPGAGTVAGRDPGSTERLPEAFESWSRFWAEVDAG
jgi:hypothetical protein